MEELLFTIETRLDLLKRFLNTMTAVIEQTEQEIKRYRASTEKPTPTETGTPQLPLIWAKDSTTVSPADSVATGTPYYES